MSDQKSRTSMIEVVMGAIGGSNEMSIKILEAIYNQVSYVRDNKKPWKFVNCKFMVTNFGVRTGLSYFYEPINLESKSGLNLDTEGYFFSSKPDFEHFDAEGNLTVKIFGMMNSHQWALGIVDLKIVRDGPYDYLPKLSKVSLEKINMDDLLNEEGIDIFLIFEKFAGYIKNKLQEETPKYQCLKELDGWFSLYKELLKPI